MCVASEVKVTFLTFHGAIITTLMKLEDQELIEHKNLIKIIQDNSRDYGVLSPLEGFRER